MPKPPRTESNRRLCGSDAVRRLRFIRHARELGFVVDVIRQLLSLADEPNRSRRDFDVIAQWHLTEIPSRIRRLIALKSEVSQMIRECERGSVADCRIIDVLAHHEHCLADEH